MPDPELLNGLDLDSQDDKAAADLEGVPTEESDIDDIDREHYLDTFGG